MTQEPKLSIKIEVMLDDDVWVREITDSWEIADMKLDSFKRQFRKKQAYQQEDAMEK